MGNIFPHVTSLKENPSSVGQTIALIEKSFEYRPGESFKIDFAPLISEENHHNCFILMDEKQNVLAHLGVKERSIKINNKLFNICMLGGIAVDEAHRGKGYFQQLFQDVLAEKRSDCALMMLWSDQEELYAKYGFILSGGQYELTRVKTELKFEKTKLSALSQVQKEQIKSLYERSFAGTYLTLPREEAEWRMIEAISSADLFIEESEGRIINYFFANKGKDLEGIVYEYGSEKDLLALINKARAAGKVWMGAPLIPVDQAQYQFMICPGDLRQITELITEYTGGIIMIRNINVMKQEVFFDFNGETLVLSVEEFLRGMFGPGPFEELGEIKPFFLSGLDSI